MSYIFRNLVFEGGGVKGIAYIGALDFLEKEKGILQQIERVGGASAGAIVAVLVGLGYSVEDIKGILWDLDFKNFLDYSGGIFRNLWRFWKKFGLSKGDFLRKWIAELIAGKTGDGECTFGDIALKMGESCRGIYLVGTNVSTGLSEVYSHEHSADMRVADAVRISMSFPFAFAAVQQDCGDVLVDGGCIRNYPVKLFDRERYASKVFCHKSYYDGLNRELSGQEKESGEYVYNEETLGFRLDSDAEIAVFRKGGKPERRAIQDVVSYTRGLAETFMGFQQNIHLHSDDWRRTIYIDTLGVKTLKFGLSDEKKKELVTSGYNGAKKYFDWYDKREAVSK